MLDRRRFGVVCLDQTQVIGQGVGQPVAQPRRGSVDQVQTRADQRHRVERREPVGGLERQDGVAVLVQLRDDRQDEGADLVGSSTSVWDRSLGQAPARIERCLKMSKGPRLPGPASSAGRCRTTGRKRRVNFIAIASAPVVSDRSGSRRRRRRRPCARASWVWSERTSSVSSRLRASASSRRRRVDPASHGRWPHARGRELPNMGRCVGISLNEVASVRACAIEAGSERLRCAGPSALHLSDQSCGMSQLGRGADSVWQVHDGL
jgi:hypothetical protein